MATEIVYIDSTLGDDITGVVGDAALPFEHIQAGVNALTIGSDGIAILAPGIYIENSGGTNYCLLDRSLASLRITPSINYQSTIRAATVGGQLAVISAQAALTFFSLGKVIVDAENDQTNHISFDPSVAMFVAIDGSHFINCGTRVFGQTDHVASLTSSLVTLSDIANALDPGGMSGNTEIDPKFDPQKNFERPLTSPMLGAGLEWWPMTQANSIWDSVTQRTPSPKRSTDYRTPHIP